MGSLSRSNNGWSVLRRFQGRKPLERCLRRHRQMLGESLGWHQSCWKRGNSKACSGPLSTIRWLWTWKLWNKQKRQTSTFEQHMVAMIPSTVSSKEPWKYSGVAPRCHLYPEWYLWSHNQKTYKHHDFLKSKYTLSCKWTKDQTALSRSDSKLEYLEIDIPTAPHIWGWIRKPDL